MKNVNDYLAKVRDLIEQYSIFVDMVEANFNEGLTTEKDLYRAINYRARVLYDAIIEKNPIHGRDWRKGL